MTHWIPAAFRPICSTWSDSSKRENITSQRMREGKVHMLLIISHLRALKKRVKNTCWCIVDGHKSDNMQFRDPSMLLVGDRCFHMGCSLLEETRNLSTAINSSQLGKGGEFFEDRLGPFSFVATIRGDGLSKYVRKMTTKNAGTSTPGCRRWRGRRDAHLYFELANLWDCVMEREQHISHLFRTDDVYQQKYGRSPQIRTV